jgi:hypothetical protein
MATATPQRVVSIGTSSQHPANHGRQTMQLSPFVSTKSWRVMPLGSVWCSRKFFTNFGPKNGVCRVPKVSAIQCTKPEAKSAAR